MVFATTPLALTLWKNYVRGFFVFSIFNLAQNGSALCVATFTEDHKP